MVATVVVLASCVDDVPDVVVSAEAVVVGVVVVIVRADVVAVVVLSTVLFPKAVVAPDVIKYPYGLRLWRYFHIFSFTFETTLSHFGTYLSEAG